MKRVYAHDAGSGTGEMTKKKLDPDMHLRLLIHMPDITLAVSAAICRTDAPG
jgi:hypothetical protein